MRVDQAHRLLGVIARDQHTGAARVQVRHEVAERRDVKQRQREQIAIDGREPEALNDHKRRRDHVRVREHGAPRDHVYRRGGDHREGIVAAHLAGRRRRLAELVPVRDAALGTRPLTDDRQGGRVRHHHHGRRALQDALDLRRREPPVDRVRDDALAGAGAVQIDIADVVLGEDADSIAPGQPQPGQPGGEPVGALQELTEGPLPRGLDQRGRVAVERRAPYEQVVDRERLGAHLLTYWPTMSAFIGPSRPSSSLWSLAGTLFVSSALVKFSTVAFHSASVIFMPLWVVFMSRPR